MSTEPTLQRSQAPDRAASRPGRNITPKQATSAALVVLVVLFALLNLQDVTMHWIVGTTHTPLIIVVAFSGLIGAGVGFLLGHRARTGPRRKAPDARP